MPLRRCAPGRTVGRLAVLGGLVAAGLVVAPAAPAAAVPDYEMPFPCAEEWTGSTRAGHSPSPFAVDFNRPRDLGDLVTASAPGVVGRVGDSGARSYGIWVRVDHGDGWSSLYAHLKAAWVTVGQPVDQGAGIGIVGATGNVTSPHLHFEERYGSDVKRPVFGGVTYVFGTTSASRNCPDTPVSGDWNGDGTTDVGVFRRTAVGRFRQALPGGTRVGRHARGSDAPVTGDWDGDGVTDVGVRRQRTRMFLLRHGDGTLVKVRMGLRGDVPVTGDWNGDRVTDVGIWRPAGARFRLLREDGTHQVVRLGHVGTVPVTGDWDGDGVTDVGGFDPGTATFTLRTVGDAGVSVVTVPFGAPGDLPVTGDWNGDGGTEVGVWSPTTAVFTLGKPLTRAGSATVLRTVRYGRVR